MNLRDLPWASETRPNVRDYLNGLRQIFTRRCRNHILEDGVAISGWPVLGDHGLILYQRHRDGRWRRARARVQWDDLTFEVETTPWKPTRAEAGEAEFR